MFLYDKSHYNLCELLKNSSWRYLNGLAWHSQSSYHHKQDREEFVVGLANHLSKVNVIRQLLDSLSDEAKELLKKVLTEEGKIKATSLFAIGGKIRSLVYKRVNEAPWRNPITISEALVYRGLLLLDKPSQTYHIGLELIAPLQAELLLPEVPSQEVIDRESGLTNYEALRHDLLVLLLYCYQHSPKVLKGGRLPVAAVRELLPLLAVNDFVGKPRQHPEVQRLWFLTQLARSAKLLEVDERWWPTPVATLWLGASTAEQLQQLWQAWHPVEVLEWSIRRRPSEWHDWWTLTDPLVERIRAKLGSLTVGQWVSSEILLSGMMLIELTELGQLDTPSPNEMLDANRGVVTELLPQLVALGLLVRADSDAIRLTKLGLQWALGSTDKLNMPTYAPVPFRRQNDHLLVPWPAPLAAIWRLAPFALLVPGGPELSFELTAKTVAAGMAKGYPLADLRHALAVGGLLLSNDLLPTQKAPRLRQAIWLEANSPAQMSSLFSNRSVKLALRGGQSVTSRHHTVDARYLNTLQKALTAMGQPPIMEVEQKDKPSRKGGAPPFSLGRDSFPANAWLLLGARLWQEQIAKGAEKYRTVTNAPPYIPIGVISALSATLSKPELAAVEQIWQETLEQLDPTDWHADAVVAELDNGTRHIAPLQQAIDNAQPVQIEYEPAGKPTSSRTIEPHYLEKRRDLWYLHAYCRKAQDKRQFRLDRIRSLSPTLQSK